MAVSTQFKLYRAFKAIIHFDVIFCYSSVKQQANLAILSLLWLIRNVLCIYLLKIPTTH